MKSFLNFISNLNPVKPNQFPVAKAKALHLVEELTLMLEQTKQKIILHKNYLSKTDYIENCKTIDGLNDFLKSKLSQIMTATKEDHLTKITDELNEFKSDLNELIASIEEALAPQTITSDDSFYWQSIKRICYRGEDRPPLTNDGQGIFQIGLSKESMDDEYKARINPLLQEYGTAVRVRAPLESNQATTIAFSKDIAAAALFPLPFQFSKLKTSDFIATLQEELDKLDISVNLQDLYEDNLVNISDLEMLKNLLTDYCNGTIYLFLKEILASLSHDISDLSKQQALSLLLDKVENNLLAKLPKQDEIWIYVVYVGIGFDVHGHGYRASARDKFQKKEQFLFFSEEICSDEIPPEHVIAAYKVERDFSRLRMVSYGDEFATKFTGEATFAIKDVTYNEKALKYFAQRHAIDIEKYKKMLEKYMSDNQRAKGSAIHLSDQGYHPSEPHVTMKKP